MRIEEIKKNISSLDLAGLYSDTERARARLLALADSFCRKYGERENAILLSAPGRSEICGNHTDHNKGVAIAAAIDRDIVAVASAAADGVIRVQSEGRREDRLTVNAAVSPDNFPKQRSVSLIAGVVAGFMKRGYKVGGFDAYTTTDVLSGSGLSSSAAFEVMIGSILNHLYNDGKIGMKEIAEISQYAENEYFGKPCGLLDQMASAVGGFVYMNFGCEDTVVEPISFSLDGAGYKLAIVGTGGSHADLTEDYAAIPKEMRAVASALGKQYMNEVSREELEASIPKLHGRVSDRAIMRALHFTRECERVEAMHKALARGDMAEILMLHRESGHSSFEYLQNVFTPKHADQGLSLAIAVSDGFISGKAASVRVHGGGFAGTIQALIPREYADEYAALMDSVFGKGACMLLSVRPCGAVKII